jgi:hypothetical protein
MSRNLKDLNEYSTGDQIDITGTCELNGTAEDLTGAAIAAGLVLADRSGLAAGTSQVAGSLITGTGRVQATFTSAMTGSIVPGRYLVEVQATRAGEPVTYQVGEILIVKGTVV